MALLILLFLYHLLLLLPSLATSKCQESFQCGNHFPLEFPFATDPQCGMFMVYGCSDPGWPAVRLENSWYHLMENVSTNEFKVVDTSLSGSLREPKCFPFMNVSLPKNPSVSFTIPSNLTLFTCYNQTSNEHIQDHFSNYSRVNNEDCKSPSPTVYYLYPTTDHVPAAQKSNIPADCGVIQLPISSSKENPRNLFDLLTAEFTLEWNVTQECYECYHRGGKCFQNSRNEFHCKKGSQQWRIITAITVPIVGILMLLLAGYILWQRKKKRGEAYLLSRNLSYDPSSKSDVEDGSFNFGIPIFSYTELVEATCNFDPSKELGDGGFGTVYYGKLRDGREVAIKRLYEHNYRRVEQFLNEIKILTSLRHPNLVSLYGCTSRRSRELLLVYEYIPNGTVADHLHGERAKESPLTWPVRMSIARETAAALAYLHKSDIIHRDVKTNNILLDSNFSVKVADFGLSRLFPIDVTHISTAPQGTPGYVDPEYHQCYQLTDKSDVYSFGVVLIELISSMTAVDISRHKHEINLANLAVNKIQRCAFDELIDPSTGYNSDEEVTRMTTSVAELAFRCLQLEKDLRPSMDEVVAYLSDIQTGQDCDFEKMKEANGNGKIPPSPETDEAVLLKSRIYQSSPTAVTDTWMISSSSNTSSSVG